jgi:hypothetical protein
MTRSAQRGAARFAPLFLFLVDRAERDAGGTEPGTITTSCRDGKRS